MEVPLEPKFNHNKLNCEFIIKLEWGIIGQGYSIKNRFMETNCLISSGPDSFSVHVAFQGVYPIAPILSGEFIWRALV